MADRSPIPTGDAPHPTSAMGCVIHRRSCNSPSQLGEAGMISLKANEVKTELAGPKLIAQYPTHVAAYHPPASHRLRLNLQIQPHTPCGEVSPPPSNVTSIPKRPSAPRLDPSLPGLQSAQHTGAVICTLQDNLNLVSWVQLCTKYSVSDDITFMVHPKRMLRYVEIKKSSKKKRIYRI